MDFPSNPKSLNSTATNFLFFSNSEKFRPVTHESGCRDLKTPREMEMTLKIFLFESFLFVFLQLLCWSLPLGIWLLHATARLPCPNAWGVVVLCFLASSCFMAAKAFGPVWGIVFPSTPWCMCFCCALCSCAEVFILGCSRTPIGHR